MSFNEYFKDRLTSVAAAIASMVVIEILLYMFSVNAILNVYIMIILVITYSFIFMHNYLRKKDFYNEIDKMIRTIDKAYLVTEIISEPSSLEEKLLYNYLYTINKSMLENVKMYQHTSEEFREYIELWCHEIKTPIATSKLLITNNESAITKSINEEINKINSYVEQVLFYSRSNNVEKDYLITKVNLKTVIDNVIKRNKKDLINNKIRPIVETDEEVYSDSKWLEFIINQILTNSVKYEAKEISFTTQKNKNNILLMIKDDGIGIKNSEVPKIFDKGFTGSNGRKKYNSTGIGLYLCKKLCHKLGHSINVYSIENQGTTITITFPINSTIKDITK